MYSNISYLAQTYFHQDFDLDADTPIGVVKVFREGESDETVDALRAEIVALLESAPSEDVLTRIWLDDGSASYDPRIDAITVRDWLGTVVEALGGDE